MDSVIDIRDLAYLSGRDIQRLNFVKSSGRYTFRKYYRSGLRSHIFEVLLKTDIQKEITGEIMDGIRMFPRAKPKKMFRILRNRFKNTAEILNEIKKYNLLLTCLGADFIAESEEFIVDYTGTGRSEIVLCGLQEYIDGEILDPWRLFGKDYLKDVFKSTVKTDLDKQTWILKILQNVETFVENIRHMIENTGYIPDLAGIGNLILTHTGNLKLVDINNIVKIRLDDTILIDDKGYPSCDVSVEVLSLLEKDLLQKKIHMQDPLYRFFLSPDRKKKVKTLEKAFYSSIQ